MTARQVFRDRKRRSGRLQEHVSCYGSLWRDYEPPDYRRTQVQVMRALAKHIDGMTSAEAEEYVQAALV